MGVWGSLAESRVGEGKGKDPSIKADSRKVGWPRRPRCLLWFHGISVVRLETPV